MRCRYPLDSSGSWCGRLGGRGEECSKHHRDHEPKANRVLCPPFNTPKNIRQPPVGEVPEVLPAFCMRGATRHRRYDREFQSRHLTTQQNGRKAEKRGLSKCALLGPNSVFACPKCAHRPDFLPSGCDDFSVTYAA